MDNLFLIDILPDNLLEKRKNLLTYNLKDSVWYYGTIRFTSLVQASQVLQDSGKWVNLITGEVNTRKH